MGEARLISQGVTTGWFDWIHSELWLLDDGLLLTRTDLPETVGHGFGPSVSYPRRRTLDGDQIAEAVNAHKLNAWLSADEMASASFHEGITASRVNLLVAEKKHKLLWLKRDKADQPMREAFASWDVPVLG